LKISLHNEIDSIEKSIILNAPFLKASLEKSKKELEGSSNEHQIFIFEYVSRLLSNEVYTHSELVEGYIQTCYEFLKLQSKFQITGCYSSSSESSSFFDIYQHEKIMRKYLGGLLATYLYWPNHFRIFEFFINHFVVTLGTESDIVEVGLGHGLMPSYLLSKVSVKNYTGIDISPWSIEQSRKSFESLNIFHKFDLENISSHEAAELWPSRFNNAICCEVLEHVEDPKALLLSIHSLLQPNSRLFITTVCNLEARDHIYLFKSVDQLRELFLQVGFIVESECILRVPNKGNVVGDGINYGAILSKKVER
jgi:2-polyprenyl-3-methyl-5-hydroxy-6-metoxy-1,4-benzoquinol methylase